MSLEKEFVAALIRHVTEDRGHLAVYGEALGEGRECWARHREHFASVGSSFDLLGNGHQKNSRTLTVAGRQPGLLQPRQPDGNSQGYLNQDPGVD